MSNISSYEVHWPNMVMVVFRDSNGQLLCRLYADKKNLSVFLVDFNRKIFLDKIDLSGYHRKCGERVTIIDHILICEKCKEVIEY